MYKQIIFSICVLMVGCTNYPQTDISITVKNESIASIDDRIFGHFLEKPSWHGEWGPEAAIIPGTHQLQDGVEALMQKMNIPVVRFPGGTDVNHQDWTSMIDNVPGRNERPLFVGNKGDTISNNFGYDEFCQLSERLGAEMMIVINFGDAYFKRKSLQDAVLHEAGLLAYLNLKVGSPLPAGMPDWPSVRAKNGRIEPYKVRYIQIANEPWIMDRELKRLGTIEKDKKDWYLHCLGAFIEAFRSIDPDIEIIADGNSEDLTVPLQELFGSKISYLSYHTYRPWGINEILKDSTRIPLDSISAEEAWNAWVAVPDIDEQGYSVLNDPNFQIVSQAGYPVAVTEWNWNGWWGENSVNQDALGSNFTKGIGAAGYIHAFMRLGDKIAIGNQSMLVGKSWGITGIRVSQTQEFEPHPYPTGEVTGFYSRLHGTQLVMVETQNIPVYEQPYRMSGIAPHENVAKLDILATKSTEKVFVHIINREFSKDVPVNLNLQAYKDVEDWGTFHCYTEKMNSDTTIKEVRDYGIFNETPIELKRRKIGMILPKRSVSILEFERKK